MKIDRLLGITIYLLMHERASASELARHFEVSRRTIQRDIDALCRAGIPVGACYGPSGGYEILHTFHIDRQTAYGSDYAYLRAALEGLISAGDSPGARQLLDRLDRPKGDAGQTIFLDFSAALEASGMAEKLRTLEQAIQQEETVALVYCDTAGNKTQRQAEPIALCYRWYDWYLLAWCRLRGDYRFFRLSRIGGIARESQPFSRIHGDPQQILQRLDGQDSRPYLDIEAYCRAGVRLPELLRKGERQEKENGDFVLRLHLPKAEMPWRGALLTMGGDVQILSPPGLREELAEIAQAFLSANGDNPLSPSAR